MSEHWLDSFDWIFHKDWKYGFCWNGADFKFSPKSNEMTPNFYAMSVLDGLGESLVDRSVYKRNAITILLQKLFYLSRRGAVLAYKSIIKR